MHTKRMNKDGFKTIIKHFKFCGEWGTECLDTRLSLPEADLLSILHLN